MQISRFGENNYLQPMLHTKWSAHDYIDTFVINVIQTMKIKRSQQILLSEKNIAITN